MPSELSKPAPTEPAKADDDAADDRKPSRGWYGLAFMVMLIGVAAFSASLNVAKQDVAQSLAAMQRLVVPGSTQLTLDKPGKYLIYYEKIGEFNGESFDTSERFPELPKLDVDIRQNATGQYLQVDRAADSETQMFNHGRANSEFVFNVPTPAPGNRNGSGSAPTDAAANVIADETNQAAAVSASSDDSPQTYTFTFAHENDIDNRLLLAVGPPVVGEMMSDWRGPFGGAAVLAFAFVISALTVLVTWMRRHGNVTERGGLGSD